MIEDLIEIRAAEKDELNFVLHSWLRSLRSASHYHRKIPSKTFYDSHAKIIEGILERGHCLVVNPINLAKIIVGYIIWEHGDDETVILHYVYVKESYRKMGLSKFLIETVSYGRDKIATHFSELIKDTTFNPYLLRGANATTEEVITNVRS